MGNGRGPEEREEGRDGEEEVTEGNYCTKVNSVARKNWNVENILV